MRKYRHKNYDDFEQYESSQFDPLGSWTGIDFLDEYSDPVQDVDDL